MCDMFFKSFFGEYNNFVFDIFKNKIHNNLNKFKMIKKLIILFEKCGFFNDLNR